MVQLIELEVEDLAYTQVYQLCQGYFFRMANLKVSTCGGFLSVRVSVHP